MKGALVVPSEFSEHFKSHSFEISGLLSWSPAMGWDVRTINEDLTPYDIIMLNFSSTENEYLSVIKQEVPDVRTVVCFDYGMSVVDDYFVSIERILQVMGRADTIFSVNRNQKAWLELAFSNRGINKQVHLIPHPTDIENMLKFKRPKENRVPYSVAFHTHQYDHRQILPLEVLKAVERKLKHPLRKSIIGVKSRIWAERGYQVPATSWPIVSPEHPDAKLHGMPIDPELLCEGGPGCVLQPKRPHAPVIQQVPKGIGWDIAVPYLGVEPFYSFLSENYVAFDSYTIDSIGRFGMDCAGVGIPLVASSKQDSSKLLYPFSTVDAFSPSDAVNAINKLFKSEEWYDRVERTAMKNLANYSFEKSKERMLRALEKT